MIWPGTAADSSEGIVKSPTESIFSDDDDIWFEASDQLTDELRVPTASPPLTPTTEDKGKLEVLTFINPGPPSPLTPPEAEKGIEGELPKFEQERELNPDHGTEQLLGGEDENDRAIGYQDRIGTSTYTETENTESDFKPVIVQDDGGPTEHAQNTDDIIEDAPHEIDIFLDVPPDEVTVAAVEMVEEDSQFLAAQGSNSVPINTQGNEAVVHVLSVQSEVYLAEALVKELRRQQKMAEACKMEAKYVEVCTAAMIKDSVSAEAEGEAISMENGGMGMGPPEVVEPPTDRDEIGSELDKIPPVSTAPLDEPTLHVHVPLHSKKQLKDEQHRQQLDTDVSVSAHNSEVHLAESLVRELKTQQRLAECCRAQSRYMEMMCASSVAMTTSKEPAVASVVHVVSEFTEENDFAGAEMEGGGEKMECDSLEATTLTATVLDSEPTEHVQKNVELESNSDELQVFEIPQQLESIPGVFSAGPKVAVCDASTNTDPTDTCTQSTSTITPEFSSQGVNTDPPPVAKEIGCNTMLNCFDVLQRAKEMDELQFLKVEHQIAVRQMNEAKSQKMVAEQLTKIVQSDLAELRQQNLTETTRRLQLENDLSDAKVGLLSPFLPPPLLSLLPFEFPNFSRLSCLKLLLS